MYELHINPGLIVDPYSSFIYCIIELLHFIDFILHLFLPV